VLPSSYTKISVNVTGLPSNTDVDCVVEVGGTLKGKVSKCQHAGSAELEGVVVDFSVVASRTDQPDELLVEASNSARAAALGMMPEGARATSVSFEVQCLGISPVTWTLPTECNTTSPDLWTDAPTFLTTGQIVDGLTPNEEYACFAAATYELNGEKQYVCTASSPPSSDTTPINPPGTPTVVLGSNTTAEIDVTSAAPDPANGGSIAGISAQCLPATATTCDNSTLATWTSPDPIEDPTTTMTVNGLTGNTTYNCFTAVVTGTPGCLQLHVLRSVSCHHHL
jgi:hypothetical protein